MFRFLIQVKIFFIFVSVYLSFSLSAVASQNRLALVIGNSAYENSPLDNPVNDAHDMGVALKKLGFEVIELLNGDIRQMDVAIDSFGRKLQKVGGVGLFFYAGHGIQSNGRNYLIPVKANISRETDLKYEAVDAGKIFDEVGYANNGLNIVILDACRDNPITRSFRSGNRGLAEMTNTPSGLLLAYSTSPGKQAADGRGRNSPYTKSLIKALEQPGLPLEMTFKEVIKSVKQQTKGQQIPWVSSSVDGDFYFKPPIGANAVPNRAANSATQANQEVTITANNVNSNTGQTISANNLMKLELLYWESIQSNPTIEKYQAYLNKYPKGNFVAIAKDEISLLSQSRQPKSGVVEKERNITITKKTTLKIDKPLTVHESSAQVSSSVPRKKLEIKFDNSISKDKQEVFVEYAEVIEEILSDKPIDEFKTKKVVQYLSRLEHISASNPYYLKLKQRVVSITGETGNETQSVTKVLTEEDKQIFEEYTEIIMEMMEDSPLSKTQKIKIENYFSRLESISPNAPELLTLKKKYQTIQ